MVTGLPPDGQFHFKKDGEGIYQLIGQGSFAEKVVVHQNNLVKIPDDVPLDKVSILSCGGCTGIGAVINTAKVKVGSNVAIIGCGGIGMFVIQAAVLSGAAKIIAIGRNEKKLQMAKQFGATHTINASKEDVLARASEISGGRIDYAFECVGIPSLMTQALNLIGSKGKAILVGIAGFNEKVHVDAVPFVLQGKELIGCSGGDMKPGIDIPIYIDLYKAGKLKLDEMVTRTYPLEKINEAFEALRKGEVIRSAIVF